MKKIMQTEKKTIVLYVKKNPSAIFKIAKVKKTQKTQNPSKIFLDRCNV
jgi:hypothetical protein